MTMIICTIVSERMLFAKLYTFFHLKNNAKELFSLKYTAIECRFRADGFRHIGYVLTVLLLSCTSGVASSDSPMDGLLFSPASAVL